MIKKIILISLGLVLAQCSSNLEGLNVDEKAFTDVPGEPLMANAQRDLVDQLVNTNVNTNVFRLFAQQWTEATYTDESEYDILTRTIPENHWNSMYQGVLKDFDQAYKTIDAQEIQQVTPEQFEQDMAAKANKLAIIEIQRVLVYQVLVDTFGDVPYTEALDIDNINPAYDDASAIYMDIISRLNTALDSMNPEYGSAGAGDLIYQGDVASWIRFGNSLKLRLGMHIADVNPDMAKTLVSEAVGNTIITNDQNAILQYLQSTPNTNPIWLDLVQSNRKDFLPADTFVNELNSVNDPRRDVYFSDPVDGEYLGAPYATPITYGNYSHLGDAFFQPDLPGDIFDASEVNFLLAEAVERGFIAGDAETYYNAAITANMEYWGVSEDDIATYLAQPTVAYATAAGDFHEKIGIQKWIALYNRGFEAWTEYRRLDYPMLQAPSSSEFDAVPKRFTYPAIESKLNGPGYTAAASAIGGDELSTPIFWDVN